MSSYDRVRTDPAIIRAALTDADATTDYGAAKRAGVRPSTIARWRRRRDREHPGWPTDTDIAAWRADEAANSQRRREAAVLAAAYRKRVYLQRGGEKIPALGTVRRLQALMALGWTQGDIGDQLGVSKGRVGHLASAKLPNVYRSTARKVAELYDRWSMVVPTDTAPCRQGEVRVHERRRTTARKLGYLPPLAWDNIDDPNEHPVLRETVARRYELDHAVIERFMAGEHSIETSYLERIEITRRWTATGRSLEALERATPWRADRYVTRKDGAA